MKRLICCPLAAAVAVACFGFNTYAQRSPGEVDWGQFASISKGGEFVEVQVKSNLLSLAAKLVEKQQPDVARLIRSVQLIHVNVVGLTDENRDEIQKRVTKFRDSLDAQGWDRNVNVRDKNGEDVGVFTKTRGGDALAGLAVTVTDGKDVVLVNIVGDIRPDQIAALGESLNIKPLKNIGKAIKDSEKEAPSAGAADKEKEDTDSAR